MSRGFTLNGLDELVGKLENASDGMQDSIKRAMERGMECIVNDAKQNYPYPSDSGKGEITHTVEAEGHVIRGRVFTPSNYAVYIEMGTGPVGEANHSGVSASALAGVVYRPDGWSYADDAGQWHYTEGQPARPFLHPAYRANRDKLRKLVRAAMTKPMKG